MALNSARRTTLARLAALPAAAIAVRAIAQDCYPSKPIRFLVRVLLR
jgi:hypothetical protein